LINFRTRYTLDEFTLNGKEWNKIIRTTKEVIASVVETNASLAAEIGNFFTTILNNAMKVNED
jgi:hypothetical protein